MGTAQRGRVLLFPQRLPEATSETRCDGRPCPDSSDCLYRKQRGPQVESSVSGSLMVHTQGGRKLGTGSGSIVSLREG